MTFREKTLWVSMVAVAAIWGSYLFDVGRLMVIGLVDGDQAYRGFVRSAILVVVVPTVATIVLAGIAPKDANAPEDVRDREFAASAAVPAYAVLCFLVVLVMLTTPWITRSAARYLSGDPATVSAVVIGNALLLALVLAHIVHCAVQLHRYRQG